MRAGVRRETAARTFKEKAGSEWFFLEIAVDWMKRDVRGRWEETHARMHVQVWVLGIARNGSGCFSRERGRVRV